MQLQLIIDDKGKFVIKSKGKVLAVLNSEKEALAELRRRKSKSKPEKK